MSSIIPGWRRRASSTPRPATPQEHERAEYRPDQVDAGEVEHVPEPVHDHVAGDHQRDREQEAQPEPSPEHLDVMASVRVVALGLVAVPLVGGVLVTVGVGSIHVASLHW